MAGIENGAVLAHQYRRWFDYEQTAHDKMLAAIRKAQPEHLSDPRFQQAVDLAAHLASARLMWLFRMGASAERVELFRPGATLDDVDTMFARMHAVWTKWLTTLSDADLVREFEYQSYDGPRFSDRVADVLTQLFLHSSYHRGQVALLLRAMGAEPAPTDFILWTRRPT